MDRLLELTEEEYSMIRDESQHLEMMLSGTIAEIKDTGKLNRTSEIFYGYARSFDTKNQTKWRLSMRGRRQISWNLMAEALVEEFCALSQSEDVHTKQLCTLIWKHFIHAVSHCVCQ
uniref:Uncharacterized protein n=1 Tax=Parascaris equorum TaxID=6256 RepID=A0A914RRI3_PAREQ